MGKGEKPTIALVFPSIYLGPCSAASSAPLLTSNSITHVLSIGATPAKPVNGITYHRISLKDSPSASLSKACDEACAIIDAALSANNGTGKILVHCFAGISRSPSVIAGYLMRRKAMSLKVALGRIVRARPQVSPQFLGQLQDMERELFGCISLEVDELPKREKDRLALCSAEDDDGHTDLIEHG
ncbi:protein-tyrosine phosphatase-like protein [Favolaschia claudopus]|uniref:protein-tyrosine-phosphatase n=1 Tax=Favolaschia claudopus TaxID=2862362 RepID=A0AAW0EIS7_9AGAR